VCLPASISDYSYDGVASGAYLDKNGHPESIATPAKTPSTTTPKGTFIDGDRSPGWTPTANTLSVQAAWFYTTTERPSRSGYRNILCDAATTQRCTHRVSSRIVIPRRTRPCRIACTISRRGKFEDVTERVGIRQGRPARAWECHRRCNNYGWMDIFIANDTTEFSLPQQGDGTFQGGGTRTRRRL